MLNTILTANKPVHTTTASINNNDTTEIQGARIWGILSEDDRQKGFELILDEKDQLHLLRKGRVLNHFDPLDYTFSEFSNHLQILTHQIRSCVFQELIANTTCHPLPSWFDKPFHHSHT